MSFFGIVKSYGLLRYKNYSYFNSKKRLLLFAQASVAETFNNDFYPGYTVFHADFRRHFKVVIRSILKIDNPTAPATSEVVMRSDLGVVSLGFAIALDDMDQTQIGESTQRPVYRIDRNIRKGRSNTLINIFCPGVVG